MCQGVIYILKWEKNNFNMKRVKWNCGYLSCRNNELKFSLINWRKYKLHKGKKWGAPVTFCLKDEYTILPQESDHSSLRTLVCEEKQVHKIGKRSKISNTVSEVFCLAKLEGVPPPQPLFWLLYKSDKALVLFISGNLIIHGP